MKRALTLLFVCTMLTGCANTVSKPSQATANQKPSYAWDAPMALYVELEGYCLSRFIDGDKERAWMASLPDASARAMLNGESGKAYRISLTGMIAISETSCVLVAHQLDPKAFDSLILGYANKRGRKIRETKQAFGEGTRRQYDYDVYRWAYDKDQKKTIEVEEKIATLSLSITDDPKATANVAVVVKKTAP